MHASRLHRRTTTMEVVMRRYLLAPVVGALAAWSPSVQEAHGAASPSPNPQLATAVAAASEALDDLPLDAMDVVRHIEDARADLYNGDGSGARSELRRVDRMLTYMLNRLRSFTPAAERGSAKVQRDDQLARAVGDLVPLFAVLSDRMSPTGKAAQTAVTSYVEADLPLRSTHALVRRAEAETEDRSYVAARSTLATALADEVYLSTAATQPIAKARTALWGAARSMAMGELPGVRDDLAIAARDLAAAGDIATGQARLAVGQLRGNVERLAAQVNEGIRPSFVSLDASWRRAGEISRGADERTTTAGFRVFGRNPRSNLLQARLYVDAAAKDDLDRDDSLTARQDLEVAESFVARVRDEGPETLRPELVALRQDVGFLVAEVEDGKPGVVPTRPEFQRVIEELGDMTQRL
jgi:hypothetical protein